MNTLIPKKFIIRLHEKIIHQSGGSHGLRDEKALNSCLSQPLMTFDGVDLYPSVIDKAAAVGFFLFQIILL